MGIMQPGRLIAAAGGSDEPSGLAFLSGLGYFLLLRRLPDERFFLVSSVDWSTVQMACWTPPDLDCCTMCGAMVWMSSMLPAKVIFTPAAAK